MRIAITGATGLLGKQVVNQLTGHKLVLVGRDRAILESAYDRSTEHEMHATDYSQLQLASILVGCDALVHLGAKKFQTHQLRFADYCENVVLTENVFAACEDVGVSNVIFASTRLIYNDAFNKLPFSEIQPVSPSNCYAISKLVCEQVGQLYNIRLKSLRLAQLVSPGDRDGFMLKTFIQRALNREPLIVWGDGLGKRDYLYVKDAARAIVSALQKPTTQGVFNIGSGVGVSHRELAEMIVRVFDPDSGRVELAPHRPSDSSTFVMDISSARRELGWSPQYTLKQALEEIKSHYV